MRPLPKLILCAFAIAVAGCANKPRPAAVEACVFPENPVQAAPQWLCPPHAVEGSLAVGFGSHPRSAAGYQFSLDQASAKARLSIATQMKALLGGAVSDVVRTSGQGTAEQATRVSQSAVTQMTEQSVAGARVVRSAVDGKGNVYVVVGLDPTATKSLAQQAIANSMRSDPSAWESVRGQKSSADMSEAVLKVVEDRVQRQQ
jgi:hypothetical protein